MSIPQKEWPAAYPADVVKLISKMTFSNGKNVVLGGSASLRPIYFPADYDAVEAVKSPTAKGFKEIIAELMTTKDCFIGDIKCGEKKEWEIIGEDTTVRNGKPVGWNAPLFRDRLAALKANGIITATEHDEVAPLLKDKPTPFDVLSAKKAARFNILRWKPKEVLKGALALRDGSTYSLEEGVKSPAMFKLDTVGFVSNNRFTDFSVIYERGFPSPPLEHSLKCDILYYTEAKDYFKALKRIFALARYKDDSKIMDALLPIFNGDLGILYSLKADCDTLLYLYENEDALPTEKIRYEIDQFKLRASNLYQMASRMEGTIIGDINSLTAAPSPQLASKIERFRNRITNLLNDETLKQMKAIKLYPLPKAYMP